ncbi:hypothetical protein BDV25DRAFT_135095 [Aspergillus avenaceus]|uniref:Uncharacterized protein n=1 Tax=Aspergillus avenaceus TaxID=36643 RepID=A0A5N6U9R0_ASPAV|nr:hypothetical protein BDV25DRAFT_135095 [Aspergillus avenaceus]
MTITTQSPRVVQTTLNYCYPEAFTDEKMQLGIIGGMRMNYDTRAVEIQDVRGQEGSYSLDVHGFQFLNRPSAYTAAFDEGSVRDTMYSEAEGILKQITGASRAHVFSHITRKSPFERTAAMMASDQPDDALLDHVPPARRVHADQSDPGAIQVLNDNMSPSEVERLRQSRWAIINMWRPLKPVPRDPLAIRP